MIPTGKRPAYLERYARVAAAAYRVEQITKAVQDEQSRVQYLDSLIATERQTLAALNETFRARPVDFADAQRLLKEQSQLETAIGLAEEAGQRAAARAGELPADERRELAALTRTQPAQAVRKAADLIARYPGAAQKVLADVERSAARFNEGDVAELRRRAAAAQRPRTGIPAADRERVEAAKTAFAESMESAYFAGPSGIRGGYEGLEVAQLRELTAQQLRERAAAADEAQAARLEARAAALDASDYTTGEDALAAALATVRATGDPQAIEDEYARTVYQEALDRQAYRNDQRADFEQEVLDSRRRLAELEQQKTRISGAYDDPRQEVLRRELRARGFKVEDPYVFKDGKWEKNPQAWRNAYLKFQNTPEHAYYIGAHERVDAALAADKPLSPSSRAENIAVSYTLMRDRRGEVTTPQELAKQLERAGIKGKELTDAVSFTMAYWEMGGPNQDKDTIAARKEQDRQAELEETTRREAATEAARQVEDQRADLQRKEEATYAVKDLRSRQQLAQKKQSSAEYVAEYKRQLGMGKTREEAVAAARDAALRVAAESGELEPFAPRTQMQLEPQTIDLQPEVQPEAEPEAQADLFQDPRAPAYQYRKVAGGFEIYRDGKKMPRLARPGTVPYRSIERVMGGQSALPVEAPKPPPKAPETPTPPPEPEPAPEAFPDFRPGATTPEPEPAPEAFDVSKMTDEQLRKLAGGR